MRLRRLLTYTCGVHEWTRRAVTLPGWYVSGYGFKDGDAVLYSGNNTDVDSNTTVSSNGTVTPDLALYVISRCPANTYNNGGNLATSCDPCPMGTATRFDPSYGYYHVPGNTQDMCGEQLSCTTNCLPRFTLGSIERQTRHQQVLQSQCSRHVNT
jgi:hypothetical protein